MKALITGASSGIGAAIARKLDSEGIDLILVARRKDKLEELASTLKVKTKIIAIDISSTYNCMKLYNKVKKEDIDILINNAGFGLCGQFIETDIDKELDMIDLNIKAVHTLTKLFLKDFKEKNRGYILNVSSLAAFQPGPLMASYYASKAYVLNLTEAVKEELKRQNYNIYVGCLCPGPVDTEFAKVANVEFKIKPLKSDYVANYAIEKMFKEKSIIIPTLKFKIAYLLSKIGPRKINLKIVYNIQKNKQK